ncbi:MAG: RimK family alpha-L-glutamate ligase [Saprospiraceae bacterium]|nr:RimK family alpha-L-glutamate ligase [Saprospiraceae bacterium]
MNILVLSRNTMLYSTQAIIEAGRKRNHQVKVIDHMLCDIHTGSGASGVYFMNESFNPVHALIPRIGYTATTQGAAVIRQFENRGVFTTLGSDPLLKVRDKFTCLQLLEGQGIQIPKTIFIAHSETIPAMLRHIRPYPVIIKLVSGTQGMGVMLAETEQNAISILEAFHATGEKVMVQQFIGEAKGQDIRAFVINGKVVAAMKRIARPGEFRSNLHRGGTSVSIRLTSAEEETAVRSASSLGLSIAGIDMLQSNDGPLVLEVNASPGLEGIEATTAVNIAREIIVYFEQNITNTSSI